MEADTIDRTKTCPLLLRVFTKTNAHHRERDFEVRGKEPEDDEIQIYTWPDATLGELADLIKEVRPEIVKAHSCKLHMSLVYPDRTGRPKMRPIGVVHSKRGSADDMKTLSQVKFQIGDFLDVAIHIDKPNKAPGAANSTAAAARR